MLCVPTASGLGVAHTLAARSLLLQTLSRAPVQSDVCYSLHAAEDLLHLPRMLHIPSASGAAFSGAVLLLLPTPPLI